MELNSRTENQTTPPEAQDLSKAIAESKERLHAASVDTSQVKRKRGRPPGTGRKNLTSNPSENAAPSYSGSSAPAAQVVRSTGEMVPILAMGLKMPFEIAAENTGCEALRLSDAEAQAPAQQLDIILAHYLPELGEQSPLKLAIMSFGTSVAIVSFTKYCAYTTWKKQQKTVPEKKVTELKTKTETGEQKTVVTEAPFEPLASNPDTFFQRVEV